MSLSNGELRESYLIKAIESIDQEMTDFLFSLGFYSGQKVTIISKLASNYIINVRDARYSIDKELAQAILV
ncbi:MAG: ferrous iron transport protein A [Clostridia bacterium]|jgi:Fe2+ transport system protein FeoA|nr:ferrous iron transport protein A [Clostridia bacterium]MBT7121938.1 ferrous iron transport protein A [Clostridia bacterium]